MRPDGILEKLEQAGFEAYFVGGCVRDTLLGRPVHDWDITTSALPTQVMAVFPRCVPTGIRHGTVTVMESNMTAEVTTFRKDGMYHDGRHPDAVVFVPCLQEDLARRDFTINAMAMDLRGRIIDCFQGKADLAAGLIRCVGAPERRFQEDALRMLRAVRFSAQLGFAIEPQTMQAIKDNASLCRKLSRERVGAEAEKVLLSSRPELLGQMISLGLLAACGAEGNFNLHALGALPAERAVRWAGLRRLMPRLALREFRLPSALVQLAEHAAAAYKPVFTRQELKNLIADAGADTARVCAVMCAQEALFTEILQSGECVSLRQLAVSGRDFPSLQGRTAGENLRALLRHVLLHPEDNNRQTLLRLAAKRAETPSDTDGNQHVSDIET